jgi:hypothetical protein
MLFHPLTVPSPKAGSPIVPCRDRDRPTLLGETGGAGWSYFAILDGFQLTFALNGLVKFDPQALMMEREG